MKTRDLAQKLIYKVIDPWVKLLIKLGITPNIVTTIGLLINIMAAIVFIIGAEYGELGDLSYIGWGCGLILFAGLFDMLDGQVARLGNMASRFGALYDSVLDRYSELIMFLGILLLFGGTSLFSQFTGCFHCPDWIHDGQLRKSKG